MGQETNKQAPPPGEARCAPRQASPGAGAAAGAGVAARGRAGRRSAVSDGTAPAPARPRRLLISPQAVQEKEGEDARGRLAAACLRLGACFHAHSSPLSN